MSNPITLTFTSDIAGVRVSGLPRQLVAGDLFEFTATACNYDGDITVYFAGASAFSVTASPVAGVYTFSKADTADLTAGSYGYQVKLVTGGVRTISTGEITVTGNLDGATTFDPRTDAQKSLEAITATLNGTATKGVQEYQIAGRSLKRYSIGELIILRNALRREVAAEKQAARLSRGGSNTIKVRM